MTAGMLEDNLQSGDGIYYLADAIPQCRILLVVGPVQLRFSCSEFYAFAVLVLDAEPGFESHFCAHGHRLRGADANDSPLLLSGANGIGRVYQCDACSYLHVDAFDQRVVIAPRCFPYFLSLLRRCAAEMEQFMLNGVFE